MEAADIQFRTAALGGFSKQDVLDYIEKANQDHAAKVEGLQKELSAMTEERDKLKARVEEAEGRLVELSAQVQKLTGELAERGAALEQSRGERELQAEEQSALQNQLSDLKERLEKSEQGARAYEAIKDRTAGIELEAHCRAQAVQAEAEERIRKTRAEVEQWLNRVQGNYGRLRADMDAAVSRACGELDQVRQTLEQISGELARQDEGLDKLTKSCCAELTHRAPDPLPLDEK